MINPVNILKYTGDICGFLSMLCLRVSVIAIQIFASSILLILGIIGAAVFIVFMTAAYMIIMQMIIIF